jgi:hypothetical protein
MSMPKVLLGHQVRPWDFAFDAASGLSTETTVFHDTGWCALIGRLLMLRAIVPAREYQIQT